jgi:hypothetical protein
LVSYKVQFASDIGVIGRQAWDELAGEEIFANYGWLRTLETNQQQRRTPFYWWIEDDKGIVAAVAARLRNPGPPAWNIDRGRYGLGPCHPAASGVGSAPAYTGLRRANGSESADNGSP